jgi:hypothetical protein
VFLSSSILSSSHSLLLSEIGVGLVEKEKLKSRMFPGWRHHSFGYHGDNGKLYFGFGKGQGNSGLAQQSEHDRQPFSTGDTVGCGYNAAAKQVFFTLNGKLVPFVAADVIARHHYVPCAALRGLGTTVEFNFGAKPFLYNATANELKESDAKLVSVKSRKLDD